MGPLVIEDLLLQEDFVEILYGRLYRLLTFIALIIW